MTEHQLQQTIRAALVHYKRWQSGEHKAAQKAGHSAKADAALAEVVKARQVLDMIDKGQ